MAKKGLNWAKTAAIAAGMLLFFAIPAIAKVDIDIKNSSTNNVIATGGSATQSQSQVQSQTQSQKQKQSTVALASSDSSASSAQSQSSFQSQSQSQSQSSTATGGSASVSQSSKIDIDVDINKDNDKNKDNYHKDGKNRKVVTVSKRLPATGSNPAVLIALAAVSLLAALIGARKYSAKVK